MTKNIYRKPSDDESAAMQALAEKLATHISDSLEIGVPLSAVLAAQYQVMLSLLDNIIGDDEDTFRRAVRGIVVAIEMNAEAAIRSRKQSHDQDGDVPQV